MNNENRKEIETFLHNIAWLRKHHGISKRKMAKILHISTSTLNKIESGVLPPKMSANVIWRIKVHFDIAPDEQFQINLEDSEI
ncbi:MAG: helix-turn-helix transcriptional regulator [Clostridia bacterium]|nr:helix-turn-helix transcriptional regulator [Clostridia bacterium]